MQKEIDNIPIIDLSTDRISTAICQINQNNEISITLYIAINENVVIKDLAINLQTKVKEEVKNSADLDVKTVNVKIVNLQDNQNN